MLTSADLQVITCNLGGMDNLLAQVKVSPSNAHVLSLVSLEASLEMLSPPPIPSYKDLVQLASTGPTTPPGQTTASFSAPLLTSLSLCEEKIQRCIPLNGKRSTSCERDRALYLQDRGAYRCLILRAVHEENMVRPQTPHTLHLPPPSVQLMQR